ncbi:translocase of chloroplast 101, chloroplastic-like [Tasmannia lanceolata]|uniref:translocase of chloroplast 101, chloroplastic-like n=1 Tax=Tasmannia lanceolata TaxID=3420 RepID=UPI00406389DF
MENGVGSIDKIGLSEMKGEKDENLQLELGDESLNDDFREMKGAKDENLQLKLGDDGFHGDFREMKGEKDENLQLKFEDEGGGGDFREMKGEMDGNLELNLGDEGFNGGFHERKDSEADEVFEEAIEEPEEIHTEQEHNFDGVVVDGDGEVEKHGGEGNGNPNEGYEIEKFEGVEGNKDANEGYEIEKFEEAMDLLVEEWIREDEMKDVGEEGVVLEDLEIGDDVRVANVVEEGVTTLTKLNGMVGDRVIGIGEGHVEEVFDVIVDGEMRISLDNEEGTYGVQARVLEYSESEDFDDVNSNGIHSVVREKTENGDFGKVNSDGIGLEGNAEEISDVIVVGGMRTSVESEVTFEMQAGIHENSQNMDFDNGNSNGVHVVVHEKYENGDFGNVNSDGIGSCPGNNLNKEISDQDMYQLMHDAMVDMDTSTIEEIDAVQDDTPQPIEVLSEIIGDTDTNSEAGESGALDWLDSEVQCSGNTQEGSENSEVIDVTDEGRGGEPQKQDEGEKSSFVEKSDIKKSHENEFVSLEEYDESTSTDEDVSVPSIQPPPLVSSSGGQPMNPPPPTRPAGLGSFVPPLGPTPRALPSSRVNGTLQQRQPQPVEDSTNRETEEYDETREKLQMIRVKFLRLAYRLGQTPHNVVVAQVLYRLGLAEQLRGSRNTSRAGAFSFDLASAVAGQLEAAGQDALDFSCTIMVLGKTGVGKSATINSIFDEVKFNTNAFQLGTQKVQDIVGTVQGIKVRVIDTPGLLCSSMDQRRNEKILHSVKRFIKRAPPDIVLYLDRLDMQSRDYGDGPLLHTITNIFGPSIWFNAIVVLTHAASAPPDGPNGTPLSYEMFVTQRSHVVQQAIRQAAGDMRLMNPVSLVENHSACRTNRAGQRVLPNGQVWKPHLLLLSFASKILAEANTLLKLQEGSPGKPFGVRSRSPPLPFLLSSLLQSRPQLKLPEEQFGDEDNMDEDLDDASDEESEYDELPPFMRLTKTQLAKLSKEQNNSYFDELEYREKLFMKKQLKEERRRRKLLKKMAASAKDLPTEYSENLDEENGGPASVPVPMPDLALPSSFDSDNPTHRYRFLDSSNQWLVRPVLESHGWDHDVGYEGLNIERLFVVEDKIPVSISGQVTKDKKESNLQMELASSIKHGERKATSLGFDMQTVGKDVAYTLRSETRFSNFTHNKTAAGLSVTILGDALMAGVKLEDKLMVNKRFRLVLTGGAMTGRGDVAYGGNLEATLRDKDYPIGRTLSTIGLSIMDWHGDLAIGCNLQSQFPVGRSTNMIARANLNNRGGGQVSISLNSSEQIQIALIALIPVFRNIIKNRLFGSSQSTH